MKLYRNLLILAGVLVVTVGAYFLISSLVSDGGTASSGKEIKLVDISSVDQITSVRSEYEGETLVYQPQPDGTWNLSVPANVTADKYLCKTVAMSFTPLRASKVIEEAPADLSVYGLDHPSILTVYLANGRSIVLYVGSKTPTGENYYVKRGDETRVCTVSGNVMSRMLYRLYDVKSKQLYAITTDDISEVQMYRGGSASYKARKMDSGEWEITEPMESMVDEILFSPVLEDIVGIEIKAYVTPQYETLAQYGLDAPRYEYIINALGKEYHVQIGNKVENEDAYYGRNAGSSEIFTIDAADLQFLDKPIEQVLEINVYLVAFEDVKKLELQIDGTDYVFDIVHDKVSPRTGDATVTMNGTTDVSFKMSDGMQWFKHLFLQLISLEMSATDISYDPVGPADITVTYTGTKDDIVTRLEFVSKDDIYYAVRKNNLRSGILVLKTDFSKDESVRAVLAALRDHLQ